MITQARMAGFLHKGSGHVFLKTRDCKQVDNEARILGESGRG